MTENRDFEQNHWSKTAEVIYKIGHDSIRLMKRICYSDRSHYENINYYDLMGSICRHLNENFTWWKLLRRSIRSTLKNSSN